MAKKITIEDLAVMVKRGFDAVDKRLDQTATKDDLKRFVTKDDVKEIMEELNATHSDVRYIKNTVDMLVRGDTAHDTALEDLTARVHRLEQKVGLAK